MNKKDSKIVNNLHCQEILMKRKIKNIKRFKKRNKSTHQKDSEVQNIIHAKKIQIS